MERLLCLIDHPSSAVAGELLAAVAREVARRDDVQFVGIGIRYPKSFWRLLRQQRRWPMNLRRFAPVFVPPNHDYTDPGFLKLLCEQLQPSLALSVFCNQRFPPALLDLLGYGVNYHNGRLPAYRGVHVTEWSLYHGECRTGFTFHRMTPRLDEGNILLEGGVPIAPTDDARTLDLAKAHLASECIPQLIELMVNHAAGTPQEGVGRYFSRHDGEAIQTIAEPATLTSGELMRRLRAFGWLSIRVNGDWVKVRSLMPGAGSFVTSDGVSFRVGRP